jgi:hypothetical protein
MIEYMQDVAGVNLDCVMNYIKMYGGFKEALK